MLLAVLIVAATMMSGCINTDKQSGEVTVSITSPKEMEVQYPITTTYTEYGDGFIATMRIILYPDNSVDMIIEGIARPDTPATIKWERVDHELHSATYTLTSDVGMSATIVLFEKGVATLDIEGERSSGTWK